MSMPDWTNANCRGETTNRFYPPDFVGLPGDERRKIQKDILDVKAICASCEIASECLAYAIEQEPYGIWGGFTARERRRMATHQPLTSRSGAR